MEITISAQVVEIKRGMAARAVQPPLTGHGDDREEALASLQRAALAWAFSLQRAGRLDKAIARYGLDHHPLSAEDIHIVMTEAPDRAAVASAHDG